MMDLALARHEAGHAYGFAACGVDAIAIKTGADTRGFYAETLGLVLDNGTLTTPKPVPPFALIAGAAATVLYDEPFRRAGDAADLLLIGPHILRWAEAVCPDDAEDWSKLDLSEQTQFAVARCTLLLMLSMEDGINRLAQDILDQLANGHAAGIAPAPLRMEMERVLGHCKTAALMPGLFATEESRQRLVADARDGFADSLRGQAA